MVILRYIFRILPSRWNSEREEFLEKNRTVVRFGRDDVCRESIDLCSGFGRPWNHRM